MELENAAVLSGGSVNNSTLFSARLTYIIFSLVMHSDNIIYDEWASAVQVIYRRRRYYINIKRGG